MVVYGGGEDEQYLLVDHNKILLQLDVEAFHSALVQLQVGDEDLQRAILRDVQMHPYKQQVMHLDFQRVVAGQALQVTVPLHFENEDTCFGVKTEGGMINKTDIEVTVSCRPRDIPDSIKIDMLELKIGESVHLSDLVMPEGVDLVELGEKGDDSDRAVVSVIAQRTVVEEDPADVDPDVPTASDGEKSEESSD